MDALYLTIIGVILAVMFSLVAAWWKAREEARGWKVSYEREKERADRQDRIVENSALATEMANKFADSMQKVLAGQLKAGQ